MTRRWTIYVCPSRVHPDIPVLGRCLCCDAWVDRIEVAPVDELLAEGREQGIREAIAHVRVLADDPIYVLGRTVDPQRQLVALAAVLERTFTTSPGGGIASESRPSPNDPQIATDAPSGIASGSRGGAKDSKLIADAPSPGEGMPNISGGDPPGEKPGITGDAA